MTERIHPTNTPPSSSAEAPQRSSSSIGSPPPGTYVVKIPKDQIYRYPPPENARRYEKVAGKKSRSSCCCRCLCWTLGLIALLVVLLAATVGVLYLVFRPKTPRYSIDDIAIRGFNLPSPSAISPEFDVTVRAQNPNDKIGIYYGRGSSVTVYYSDSDVNLCNGDLPAFYQPSNNVTIIQTALKGSKILLTSAVNSALVSEQNQGNVPLTIYMKVPVKIKIGAVKTWTITVKVKCDVSVDSLTTSSKIVSSNCKKSVKL